MWVAVITHTHWLVVSVDNGRPVGTIGTDDTPTTSAVVATNKLSGRERERERERERKREREGEMQ